MSVTKLIEQLITDLDTGRDTGRIYTYGQVQERLRAIIGTAGVAETERRAPVQGGWEGDRKCEPGTIAWSEHLEAWATYDKRYHGQSAEDIARRGGFGHRELRQFLGHAPETFVEREGANRG